MVGPTLMSAVVGCFSVAGVVVVVVAAGVVPSVDGSEGNDSGMKGGATYWRATRFSSALVRLGSKV